jgi:Protein of unknown function (DUF559)
VTVSNRSKTLRKRTIGTVGQWRADGLTAARLRYLIRQGYLVQVRRGVYVTRPAFTAVNSDPCRAHALQVAAVRTAVGRNVVGSHHSAALIHGLDLLKRPPAGTVEVTCRPPRRSRSRHIAGISFHNAALPDDHLIRAHGTSVTTAARTVIDLARALPFIEAVVVADSALRMRKTTKEELEDVCDACGRWRGITRARRAVAFSNGLAESVLESCARVIFDAYGLQAPEIQVTLRGPGFVFRVDFCWEEHKTIAEADGLAKYSGGEDMLAQFRRDRLLRDAGYKVVHFTWRELFESSETVIDRIRKALAAPTPY